MTTLGQNNKKHYKNNYYGVVQLRVNLMDNIFKVGTRRYWWESTHNFELHKSFISPNQIKTNYYISLIPDNHRLRKSSQYRRIM